MTARLRQTASMTDTGRKRRHNEDAFVVADLTGGALLQDRAYARFDVGVRGVLLAADHALHFDDEARRDHDGIDGRLRRSTVAAATAEFDGETVRHRRADACSVKQMAVGNWRIVQREGEVRLRHCADRPRRH